MSEDTDMNAEAAWLDEVVAYMREPVERSSGTVDAVVRAAMGTATVPAATRGVRTRITRLREWLFRPRLSLSPLSAAGWSLAVAALAVILIRAPFADAPVQDGGVQRHQFVLIAPEAASVSLAGDFNGWDPAATPLVRQGDAWTVELTLQPGRHVYSFVVDGDEWVPDAGAPRAPEDDFGRPSSVLLVGRGT